MEKKANHYPSSKERVWLVEHNMEELYNLSPNRKLFEILRGGKNDEDLSSLVIENPETILERVNNHLVVLLTTTTHEEDDNDTGSSTTQQMEQFFANTCANEDEKVLAYGECILALTALTNEGQRAKLKKILVPFLGVAPRTGTFVRARREWLCILLNELERTNSSGTLTPEKILDLRYVIASWTDNCRPGLVGESFFMVGRAALDAGDATQARRCFESVRNDMKTNLDKAAAGLLPSNLRFEVRGVLYWYLRACESLTQILMDDDGSSSATTIQREVESMKEKFPPPPRNNSTTFNNHAAETTTIMVGPIARTYLSREEYLKKLLKEIFETNDHSDDNGLEPVCYRYDYCHEIDDILFAIERHRVVLPLVPTNTVRLSYEPNIQEILDVLKILEESNE